LPGRLAAAWNAGRGSGVVWTRGHCPAVGRIQLGTMIYFSDLEETASRFGDYIDDLHDVFRCHGVDFGSPEDFFAFARTAKYHTELRGDVMRVVKSVMDGETDISFRTILTIIAVASGGPAIETFDREMSTPVHQVIESLIGVGTSRRLDADLPDSLGSDLTAKETAQILAVDTSSPVDGAAAGDTDAAGHADALQHPDPPGQAGAVEHADALEHTDEPVNTDVEEPLLEKAASDSSSLDQSLTSSQSLPNGYSGSSNGHQGPLNDFGGSNTLAESLTRLELNSLQLKIYLDSIDQRISRMEPRLENVAPFVLPAAAAHIREEPGARFSAAIPSEKESQPPHNVAPVSNQQGRAATAGIVASGPSTVPARPGTDSKQFNARQFNSGRRLIALPILVGVAMLLLAASLVWRFERDTGHVAMHPVNASMEGGANVAGANVAPRSAASVSGPQPATVSGLPVAAVSEPSVAPVRGVQGKSSASSNTGEGVRRPVDKPLPPSKKSAQVPFRSPLRSSSSATAPTMAKDAAEVTDPSDSVDDLSSVPLSNGLVNVSSGVMAANLLSAPKPSYPTLASLTHTQGNVVMQAVISKDGTVGELHVIKGHRLLRGAAKNAVRSWRYRPYKIDGVPVDVATTVSVDFSLHH
jgi:TonB family protein